MVAGRIDAAPSGLTLAVNAWLVHLRAKGRSDKTLRAYREVLAAGARDQAWTEATDLTFEAVTAWMDGKVAAGDWKGTTYNRNLACFRSFTKHLRKCRRLPDDPLEDAERADDDGDDGARAAVLSEARGMIRHAWIRGQSDGRARGDAALYMLCEFAHACRSGEPEQWRWKHVRLDDPVPHVRWAKDIQKNGKAQDCALAPELVEQLRAHRERTRLLARSSPVSKRRGRDGSTTLRPFSPEDPEAFVFPVTPSRGTFRAYRDALGIAAQDGRGRGFSPHSARKFFSTCLTGQGVAEKMVDRLMRHAGRVEARYYDPPLEEQAAAAAKLPRLWPECGQDVDKPWGERPGLTNADQGGQDVPATPVPPPSSSIRPRSPDSSPPEWHSEAPLWLRGLLESLRQQQADLTGSPPKGVESASTKSGMPIPGLIIADLNTDLGTFLVSLGRLLLHGAPAHVRGQARPKQSPAA